LKKDLIEIANIAVKNKHLKDQKNIIQLNTFGLIQMAYNGNNKDSMEKRIQVLNIVISTRLKEINADEATRRILALFSVSKSYSSEKGIHYDKGGFKRDASGKFME